MKPRLLLSGLIIWTIGTVALRLAGTHLLRPADPLPTLILYAVSFPSMAWMVRAICRGSGLKPEEWLGGAVSIALPTLLLDPFSCLFFPVVFPNMPPDAAGVFGGWMLWCCAGALV